MAILKPENVKTFKDLSAVSDLIKAEGLDVEYDGVNEALKVMYGVEHAELNTYAGWKKEGFQVKKGAKSYTFWTGLKSYKKKVEKEDGSTEEKEGKKKFRMCKLFSRDDVEEAGKMAVGEALQYETREEGKKFYLTFGLYNEAGAIEGRVKNKYYMSAEKRDSVIEKLKGYTKFEGVK